MHKRGRAVRLVMPVTVVLMILFAGCARRQRQPVTVFNEVESAAYYTAGAESARTILEQMERQFGPDDPRLITPLMTLSMIYFRQDHVEESDAMLERAWELLEANPDVDITEIHFPVRYGALVAAAEANDRLDTRTHLALGADINQRDAKGKTALHHFSRHGDEEMVRRLLNEGAVAGSRDWQGQTARDLAEKAEHADIVELLGQRRRQSAQEQTTAPEEPAAAENDWLTFPDEVPAGNDTFGPTPPADEDFFQQPDAVDDDFFY